MSLKTDKITLVLGDGDSQIKALDEVSIDLASGELLMILGPSGSGKSSLLAVCGGLRTPTSGTVHIDGQDITAASPSELTNLRREKIGFVFQQSNLVPSLTALDQLLLMVHMQGRKPNGKDHDRARMLLDDVGMSERSERRPGQLSGGERQRVGIARAFMTHPRLLLVDEPTSMLDHDRGRQIVEILKRSCHDHNVATMMVTHDRSIAEAADRVAHIWDGKLSENELQRDATH